jgi:Ca2+-transporting ATPase
VEVVLERCRSAVDLRGDSIPLDREAVNAEVSRMAGRGLRVLAMARAYAPAGTRRLDKATLPEDFVFLGLQGMIDPPRPEAIEAVAACQRAGIRVKMITGDHAGTALAIGKQLGLVSERPGFRPVLTGKDLALLEGETLADAAENVSVFARVTPEQKLALVRSLQARGQVVAMTGDGVNDGPALKQANIGVAMGITGTEVAKEASDMVLTDDNFASIRAAVEEGRNVFDNLTKTITWALPSNLGQGLVILAAAMLGETMPILPLQVLWINMTTGGVLGLFLALEPKERDLMDRPPRKLEAPLLSGTMLGQVVLVGALILVAAFGLFEWELRRGAGIDAARTVALNTVAVIQTLTLLNCRSLRNSILSIGVFSNYWLWAGMAGALALQVALTYVPLLNTVFHTAPIGVDEWVRILGAGLVALAVVEGFKWLQRGRA